jgi:hypothetical protein
MERHLLDRPAPDDLRTRATAFVRIEREQLPNPATRALQRAPRLERPQPLREALRIARGRTA